MFVRTKSNTLSKPPSGDMEKIAGGQIPWNEFTYRMNSEIFGEAEPADCLYQIREGAVRTYKLLSDGRRQIGAFHLPGDLFGFEHCGLHRFTAEAIVDTTVWIAKSRIVFSGLAKDDILATNNVRDLLTRTLEHAEEHLLLLGRQTSVEKIAAFLLEMDRRLDEPQMMALPMTRRDIADYLGLTVETVARSLSILRDDGILSFIGQTQRQLVLHDRFRLVQRTTSPEGTAIQLHQ